MDYSNPEIPEGINTSREHPLKEFAILTLGILAVLVAAAVVLGLLADRLARHIPFAYEVSLARRYADSLPPPGPIERKLQALADRLAPQMDLEDGMRVSVSYLDQDTVNAFATLGGHVVMYRGLMEKLPNENALAMVLAHEIAHIRYRHPVRSLGRGVAVGLTLAALTGFGGNGLTERALGKAGLLTLLHYSREQEREADLAGLAAVQGLYGHTGGALDLYRVLLDQETRGDGLMPGFFCTHPLTRERLKQLQSWIDEQGWGGERPSVPLSLPWPATNPDPAKNP